MMDKLNVKELIIEVTRFCNLDCKHCFRGNSKVDYMDPNTICNILENVGSINKLVISGGEPLFAYRQLKVIANCINYYDIDVNNITIITNGTLYNNRIVDALNDLKDFSNSLTILVSNDKFHQMSIENKELTNLKEENIKKFKETFDARLYYSPEDELNTIYCAAGNARSISEEELGFINNWGNIKTNYRIVSPESDEWDEIGIAYSRFAHTTDDKNIKGVVDIDVDGYLVNMYVSYNECVDYHNDYVNVNEIGLLESIKNFKPYFTQVHDNYKKLIRTNSK